jgi:hypothetical protein
LSFIKAGRNAGLLVEQAGLKGSADFDLALCFAGGALSPSLRAKQSNPDFLLWQGTGLLRFARNDGGRDTA